MVDIRVTRARSQLIILHAFFGSLAMRLRVGERNDIDTMATDGTWMWYAKKFLDEETEATILFTVAHEVLHCALGHHVRRGGRDPKRWNIACDYVVNWMLSLAGFEIPSWAYLNADYAGLNAEEVYRILELEEKQKPPPPPPEPDQPEPDQGEGATEEAEDSEESEPGEGEPEPSGDEDGEADGGSSQPGKGEGGEGPDGSKLPAAHGDPGRCGEVLDAAPEYDKAALAESAEEWQVFTRQAANIARRQGEGKLPGFAEEIVTTLNDPHTDWREVFRRFADPSTTKDYSWTMPNRRFVGLGYYTPGTVSDGVNHVVMLIDSSASVDTEKLQRGCTEAQSALDDGAVDKVTVVFIDTRVNKVTEYTRGETIDFTVQGRGGTDFAPAFEWLKENAPDASGVVYFTDLDCTSFGEKPACPVLWAVYGDDPRMVKSLMGKVPFGECVEI